MKSGTFILGQFHKRCLNHQSLENYISKISIKFPRANELTCTLTAGIRILDGKVTDSMEAEALTHKMDQVEIYSASWGPPDDGSVMEGPGPHCARALEKCATQVRQAPWGYGIVLESCDLLTLLVMKLEYSRQIKSIQLLLVQKLNVLPGKVLIVCRIKPGLVFMFKFVQFIQINALYISSMGSRPSNELS